MGDMNDSLDFERAWKIFYEKSDNRPSDADFRRAREVMGFLGAVTFSVTANYITDTNHRVHVNTGFLVAKDSFPGGHPDDTYAQLGFICRLWFANRGTGGGTAETSSLVKVLCPKSFVKVNAGVPCDYCEEIHTES